MTGETTLRCFNRHRAAQTCLQRLGHRAWMQDSEIETLSFLIITDTAFIEDALMLKHISLAGLTLAKAVKDGFGNRARTVSDRVARPVSFANDFVVIRTVAKVQSRMGFQNLTAFDRRQCATHRISQTLCS